MDRIEKFLRSLPAKEQHAMLLLLEQIRRDPLQVPGCISLAGLKGFYRVRMGHYRIIFFIDPATKMSEVKYVGRRNEKTYKNLA